MSELPTLPDSLWAVLKTLAQPARAALSYQEIASVVDLTVPTIAQHVTTIVDYGWATIDRHGRFYRVTVTDAGVEASGDRAKLPTAQAVVAEARRICREEELRRGADPYYQPYVPSDRTAYALSQQYGPEQAIVLLRQKLRDRHVRYAAQEDVSDRAERVREVRARAAYHDLVAERASLSPGQRLDRALNALLTQQATPAARLDVEPVTDGGGGKDDANPVPKLHDDTLGWAQRRVSKLLHELEDAVDGHGRRLFDFEREAVA